MKFDINALIQKQKRPIKDKKQLSAELKKTIEQEEDPRIQKHKINALKKGYTPEEVMDLTMNYELKMYVRFAIRTYHILTTNMKSSANRSHVLRSIH